MDCICLVCKKELLPDDRLSVTPCGHMFHTDCLELNRNLEMCAACAKLFEVSGLVRLYGTTNNDLSDCDGPRELLRLQMRQNELLQNRKEYQEKHLLEVKANLKQHLAADKTNQKRIKSLAEDCELAQQEFEYRVNNVPKMLAKFEKLPREEELWPTLVDQRLRVQQLEASIAHYFSENELAQMVSTSRSERAVMNLVMTQKKAQQQLSEQESETARQVARSRRELYAMLCHGRELQTKRFELTNKLMETQQQQQMAAQDRELRHLKHAMDTKSTVPHNKQPSMPNPPPNRAGTRNQRPRPRQLIAVQNSMSRRMSC